MLVDSTYACRPGKGVHAAAAQVQGNLRRFGWVVQVDVNAYFPSICHVRLKALLATRFKGQEFLALLDRIIDGGAQPGTARGLPIGALTSQHFGCHPKSWRGRARFARRVVEQQRAERAFGLP